ncbi:DUF2313 domain-containing protein [Gluconacetobacter azotocaptans]|uniref:putative phage tail protein n=1 Tax=Gluconacetobacter azotocaptans TaxID=142834 RepID=UPI0019564B66|nr:putative phage tail protein [Gluconacetobacter azotocaptans]MBM9400389.1 DUF2313 domain-containing protein [Gluconacetobacter azotocaptans]
MASLFPPGWAWQAVHRHQGNMWAMLQPVASVFAQIEQAAEALLPQVDPGMATDLLDDYERVLGDDACIGSVTTLPFAQRQTFARVRWTRPAVVSIPDIISYAASLGYTVTVTEFQPAYADLMRAGDPLNSVEWDFAWQITAPGVSIQEFVAGSSCAGDALAAWENTLLECQMRSVNPAHAVVLFGYDGVLPPQPSQIFSNDSPILTRFGQIIISGRT